MQTAIIYYRQNQRFNATELHDGKNAWKPLGREIKISDHSPDHGPNIPSVVEAHQLAGPYPGGYIPRVYEILKPGTYVVFNWKEGDDEPHVIEHLNGGFGLRERLSFNSNGKQERLRQLVADE